MQRLHQQCIHAALDSFRSSSNGHLPYARVRVGRKVSHACAVKHIALLA